MIIGACGFVMTGSSAVTDLLREYDSTWVFDDREFTIVHSPDGIEDLEFQLTKHATKYTSSVVAFERFRRTAFFTLYSSNFTKEINKKIDEIVEDYIDSLVQIRWNGMGAVDKQLFSGKYYSNPLLTLPFYKFKRKLHAAGKYKIKDESNWPLHRYEFAIEPENFIEKSQAFTKKILAAYGARFDKKIVIDQPFAGNDPQRSFRYFEEECKAIIMDRDPRDWYLATIYARKKSNWGFQTPVNNVKDFVKFYRSVRNNASYRGEYDNVIKINLEELIYKYDDTVKKIEQFCRLEKNPRPRTIFEPKISIANTQLIKKYPEYKEDISYIEQELFEYLFPFEEYGDVDTSGEIFLNKSPLNKW